MAKAKTQVSVALDDDVLGEIDRRISVERKRNPGQQVSRADIIRRMIQGNISLHEAAAGLARDTSKPKVRA